MQHPIPMPNILREILEIDELKSEVLLTGIVCSGEY